jgi:hypothetical protein
VCWCDVHVKLGGDEVEVAFWGRGGLDVVCKV